MTVGSCLPSSRNSASSSTSSFALRTNARQTMKEARRTTILLSIHNYRAQGLRLFTWPAQKKARKTRDGIAAIRCSVSLPLSFRCEGKIGCCYYFCPPTTWRRCSSDVNRMFFHDAVMNEGNLSWIGTASTLYGRTAIATTTALIVLKPSKRFNPRRTQPKIKISENVCSETVCHIIPLMIPFFFFFVT